MTSSTESVARVNKSEEAQLARLVTDPHFQDLERRLSEFNILEALGVVRQELRHSDFLAFLLNPAGKHGQGDYFLKRFLQIVVLNAGVEAQHDIPISPVELDVWSMENTQVFRELYRIDVLLVDETHHFAAIIENKIGAGEHTNQLARYKDAVQTQFPKCTRVLGIFLTPAGYESSLPEHYLAASYTLVHDVIEDIIAARATTLGPRPNDNSAPLHRDVEETHNERVIHWGVMPVAVPAPQGGAGPYLRPSY
jgi:hypothetical protein